VRRQVPDERFSQGRPMIDIATEIHQSPSATLFELSCEVQEALWNTIAHAF